MGKHYVEHEQQVVSHEALLEAQGTLGGLSPGTYRRPAYSGEHVPGGARMSEDTGRKFTEILIKKHRRRSK